MRSEREIKGSSRPLAPFSKKGRSRGKSKRVDIMFSPETETAGETRNRRRKFNSTAKPPVGHQASSSERGRKP